MVRMIIAGSIVISSILGIALFGLLVWWLMKYFKWGPYKEKFGTGSRAWLAMMGTGESYHGPMRSPPDNYMYKKLILEG